MKYLLTLLIVLASAVVARNQISEQQKLEPLLISQTNIYLKGDGVLMVKHWYVPPYFQNGAQVEYQLFEKFLLEHEKDQLLSYVEQFKNLQDSLENAQLRELENGEKKFRKL